MEVVDGTLKGILSAVGEVAGTISVGAGVSGAISRFNDEYPPYTGSYEVTPEFAQQVLPTQNKVMHDDVTVHAIQVESVTNLSGGKTVYIGGLIDG